MSEVINVADLFSGCGGLSLGFELYDGEFVRYRTVIALDNDPAPLRCLNANHPQQDNTLPIGRLYDLTWFTHPSEVLLYYLVHFALWQPDSELSEHLNSSEIGLDVFLTTLRSIDQDFDSEFSRLIASGGYLTALSNVDSDVYNMAICKSFLNRLGLVSLRSSDLTQTAVPWREEYSRLVPKDCKIDPIRITTSTEIFRSLQFDWNKELTKLVEASQRTGRGQHRVVAARVHSLVEFLFSEPGVSLRDCWLQWRARRDTLRAEYCTAIHSALESLYSGSRRVQLVLGGPPCKGFSRVGRPVIESLRQQGVHAWTSKEYGDERNALLHKYVLFLLALRPDAFIFENVSNFTSKLRTPNGTLEADRLLEESIEALSLNELHYSVHSRIITAQNYGVPQDRQRFIMVGFDGDSGGPIAAEAFFALPIFQHHVPLLVALLGLDPAVEFDFQDPRSPRSSHLVKAFTLIDPKMPASHQKFVRWIRQPGFHDHEAPDFTDAHVVRRMRADDLALVKKFAPGHRWMDYGLRNAPTIQELMQVLAEILKYIEVHPMEGLPTRESILRLMEKVNENLVLRLLIEEIAQAELGGEHHLLAHGYLSKGSGRHGDWFERLSADRPSKTIVAHIGKDTYGYIHPFLNRALSIREAARIQTFPDFFCFGSVGIVDGYSMIGNAVPPLLANAFATQLAQIRNVHMRGGTEQVKKSLNRSREAITQLALLENSPTYQVEIP